jgi:DNA polymerase III subunit delta
MPSDLTPEQFLDRLKRGQLGNVYLFYGAGEFRIENLLSEIRETLIPESARDFNLQIFYGADTTNPADITDAASSLPFLSPNRLIIVKREENIPVAALESFIPYIDNPAPSTCLIFVSSKTDFRKEFYKKIREAGGAVHFKQLYDRQVAPWMKRFARDLGLNITEKGCIYLQGIVGNRLRDLYTEMEKLHLRHGSKKVGEAEIRELAIYSRIYTIFELMDEISLRHRAGSLSILNRYLEEEGKDAVFGLIGMLNRQIRLIIQGKSITDKGGQSADVARKLQIQPFLANKILEQARNWRIGDLEKALDLLYRADRHLKSGSQPRLILEHLLLSL